MNDSLPALSSVFSKSWAPGERGVKEAWIAASALGAGAALMYYFLDRARGAGRRARVMQKLARTAHAAGEGEGDASDTRLAQRLDAAINRTVSHSGAIFASVREGTVTLSGPILKAEINRLIAEVEQLPGVRKVLARLTAHDQAGRVPALQGRRNAAQARSRAARLLDERWSPASRLLAGMAGGALLAIAWRIRRPGNLLLTALGASLLARSASSRSIAELAGHSSRRIYVHKSLHISAPVEQVFEFWRRAENFPGVMSHVLEVRRESEYRTRWKVAGPAGVPVEWTSEITDLVPQELIAWRSLPGSAISHSGSAHFSADPAGGTRVEIHLAYLPPGGALGHTVARLFGADPKSEMDSDLARLKTEIETGRTPHDAAREIGFAGQPVTGAAGMRDTSDAPAGGASARTAH